MFSVKEIDAEIVKMEKIQASAAIYYLNLLDSDIEKYQKIIATAIHNRESFCTIEPLNTNETYLYILNRELSKLDVIIEHIPDEKKSIKISNIQKLIINARTQNNIKLGGYSDGYGYLYALLRTSNKSNSTENKSDEQSKKRKSSEEDSHQEPIPKID